VSSERGRFLFDSEPARTCAAGGSLTAGGGRAKAGVFFRACIAGKIDDPSRLDDGAAKKEGRQLAGGEKASRRCAGSCLRAAINCPICRSCYNAGRFTRERSTCLGKKEINKWKRKNHGQFFGFYHDDPVPRHTPSRTVTVTETARPRTRVIPRAIIERARSSSDLPT